MPQPDPYREPFLPGQIYPPLGFAPDGTPQYLPGQQPAPPPRREAQPPVVVRDEEPPQQRSGNRLLGIVTVAAILAFVLLAVTIGRALTSNDQESDAQQVPTIIQVPDTPTDQMPQVPGIPTNEPDTPGAPIPGQIPSAGKAIEYQVTSSTPATIIYSGERGLQTVIGAPTTWSTRFTGAGGPLRVLVLAGEGAASCRITVDGKPMVSDEIAPESIRRLVSCRG